MDLGNDGATMGTLTVWTTITHMFTEHTKFISATRKDSATLPERLGVGRMDGHVPRTTSRSVGLALGIDRYGPCYTSCTLTASFTRTEAMCGKNGTRAGLTHQVLLLP